MEFSGSNVKKILIFQETETLKRFLTFREMKIFSSNIKAFLIFSQKKAVLILQETETPKKILTFYQKKAFLIFREMETPKKFLIF